jgi:hypothetical protein
MGNEVGSAVQRMGARLHLHGENVIVREDDSKCHQPDSPALMARSLSAAMAKVAEGCLLLKSRNYRASLPTAREL